MLTRDDCEFQRLRSSLKPEGNSQPRRRPGWGTLASPGWLEGPSPSEVSFHSAGLVQPWKCGRRAHQCRGWQLCLQWAPGDLPSSGSCTIGTTLLLAAHSQADAQRYQHTWLSPWRPSSLCTLRAPQQSLHPESLRPLHTALTCPNLYPGALTTGPPNRVST